MHAQSKAKQESTGRTCERRCRYERTKDMIAQEAGVGLKAAFVCSLRKREGEVRALHLWMVGLDKGQAQAEAEAVVEKKFFRFCNLNLRESRRATLLLLLLLRTLLEPAKLALSAGLAPLESVL